MAMQASAPAQPKKKSKLPLVLGAGCVVVLLGVAAAGIFFYMAAKKGVEQLSQAGNALTAGVPASGVCAQAIDCCNKIMEKSGAGSMAGACQGLKLAPEEACQQALTGYLESAKTMGIQCGGSGSQAKGAGGLALFSGDGAVQAGTKLKEKVGGKVMALELTLYPDRALLQAEDPNKKGNVHQYEFANGTVGDPIPVTLTTVGEDAKLDANLFDLSEVNLAAIAALKDAAINKAGAADAQVTHMVVRRALPETTDVRIRVFVSGSGGGSVVEADAQGAVR
jgi:hypothetical protein